MSRSVSIEITDGLINHLVLNTKKIGDCIEWQLGRDSDGYGRISVGGGRNKRVHRVAAMIFIGIVTDSDHVLHTCDNVICVNPAHLFLGNHNENMKDRSRKGRVRSHVVPKESSAKIAKEYRLKPKSMSDNSFARKWALVMGVSPRTILRIVGISY